MSPPTTPGDQASVTIGLAISPLEAFAAFTQDIDLWWFTQRLRNPTQT